MMRKLLFLGVIMAMNSTNALCAEKSLFLSNVKEIEQKCSSLQNEVQTEIQKIIDDKDDVVFSNSVEALEYIIADYMREVSLLTFLAYVSPDKQIRDAASECEVKTDQFMVETFSNEKLFARVKQMKESKSYDDLKGHQKRLVDDFYKSFVANGLNVSEKASREKILTLNKELAELSSIFSKNIQEVKDDVWVTKQDLDGLEESFIEALEKKKDKYKLTSDYPIYFPVMKYAKNEKIREKVSFIYGVRGGNENVQILENIILRRDEIAKLMGYENHADKVISLSDRMAKSYTEVRSFLNQLIDDLKGSFEKEFEQLQEFKCKETNCKSAKDTKIHQWDYLYYLERILESQGDLDIERIKEYFPLDQVTKGMFQIYEKLLGIQIKEAQTTDKWFDGIQFFEVFDTKTNKKIGSFYIDMFPREGKYSHAAVFGLVKSQENSDGSVVLPMVAMVCNFNPPTKDRPSLLTHDEVETYFHEFGHVMHGVVAKTQYGSQGGTSVARDFVEAPSQMLENWVWKKEPLQLLSKHYQTGKPLPNDMLQQMLKLKKVNQAIFYMRQLALASIDLDYHSMKTPVDTTKVWNDRFSSMTHIDPQEGTYRQASWGHMTGYDAGYYGYLWSKVYAEDMFSVFEKKGIMNSVIGLRYRREILEPGGSKDLNRQLKRFLRREPNNKAFLKNLGL
ncbi:MAG: Zn-dependent oligopeptidase [Bdellovibrionales bacterium]|nr:Zn-dependent oligopeptidase [Bdellovibrionales bacterium]